MSFSAANDTKFVLISFFWVSPFNSQTNTCFIFFQKHMQKVFEVRETRNIFMKPYANHKNGTFKHFKNGLLIELLGLMRVYQTQN